MPQAAAVAGTRERSPARRIAFLLAVGAVAALAVRLPAYLAYAVAAVRSPYGLDYGEGIVLQQAMLMGTGRAYGDVTQFPFLVFHYPPLFHALSRALAGLGVDLLLAGRCVSVAATLGIGALAAALAYRAVQREVGRAAAGLGAAVAGLSVFAWYPVVAWSPLMRVDMLAMALSFAGVWCAAGAVRQPWRLHAAMALFLASLLTKQTCLAAPFATVLVTLLAAPRQAVRAVLTGACLGGAALLALSWATGGGFLAHVVLYNVNRFSMAAVLEGLLPVVPHLGLVILAVAGAALGWSRLGFGRRPGRPWVELGLELARVRRVLAERGEARLFAILLAYAAAATAMLVTLGKSGASVNYLIEWMCVGSVLVGTLVARLVGAERDARPPLLAFAAPALIVWQAVALPASLPVDALADPSFRADADAQVAEIRAAGKPVSSDDMVSLIRAGQEVPWEPAIFAELASTGRWDERLILDLIERRAFAFMVTEGAPGTALFESRYTPAVRHAMAAAYPRVEVRPWRTTWRPLE